MQPVFPSTAELLYMTWYLSQWTASSELSPGSDSGWLAPSAISNWWAGVYPRDEWSSQGDIWAAGYIDRCRQDLWASFNHMRKKLVLCQIIGFLSGPVPPLCWGKYWCIIMGLFYTTGAVGCCFALRKSHHKPHTHVCGRCWAGLWCLSLHFFHTCVIYVISHVELYNSGPQAMGQGHAKIVVPPPCGNCHLF